MPYRSSFTDLGGETARYIQSRRLQSACEGTRPQPETAGRTYPARDAPDISLRQWLKRRIAATIPSRV